MDTTARHLGTVAALAALVYVLVAWPSTHASRPAGVADPDGDASGGLVTIAPNRAVQASFTARSYAPGQAATLRVRGDADGLRIDVFHAGAGGEGPLQGAPVAPGRALADSHDTVSVRVGPWPSGLYYARVVTPGKGAWYAPFVVRPRQLGTSRTLVVLPTNTWQAYNFEDDDSWYEHADVHRIDLTRPYIDGGVPPHYHGYDRGFIRWLALHHESPDFVSDDDLDRIASGAALARDYDLIVFSGHEEYVTGHEYDVIDRYRDHGGNIAFLSANDFFYKVVKHGDEMDGRWRWRDLGRPEAALVGAQYVDWNHGTYPNRPFTTTGVEKAPWLFTGTGLRNGDTFGVYGIEIDARTAVSPRGTQVLADIPSIFGTGKSAQMTYYTTPRGAKVFSAGVMNFGGSALWPVVSTMMENIWRELARP
jgi:hypothetical protein